MKNQHIQGGKISEYSLYECKKNFHFEKHTHMDYDQHKPSMMAYILDENGLMVKEFETMEKCGLFLGVSESCINMRRKKFVKFYCTIDNKFYDNCTISNQPYKLF